MATASHAAGLELRQTVWVMQFVGNTSVLLLLLTFLHSSNDCIKSEGTAMVRAESAFGSNLYFFSPTVMVFARPSVLDKRLTLPTLAETSDCNNWEENPPREPPPTYSNRRTVPSGVRGTVVELSALPGSPSGKLSIHELRLTQRHVIPCAGGRHQHHVACEIRQSRVMCIRQKPETNGNIWACSRTNGQQVGNRIYLPAGANQFPSLLPARLKPPRES
jgi:hypothetical protein